MRRKGKEGEETSRGRRERELASEGAKKGSEEPEGEGPGRGNKVGEVRSNELLNQVANLEFFVVEIVPICTCWGLFVCQYQYGCK